MLRIVTMTLSLCTLLACSCAGSGGGDGDSGDGDSGDGDGDSGDGDGDSGDGDGDGDDGTGYLVFLSPTQVSGDVRDVNPDTPPVEIADGFCQVAGEVARPGRFFIAWFSDNDIDAIDRGNGAGPWRTPSGDEVFSSIAQLALGTLDGDIREDQAGNDISGGEAVQVWTGTAANGMNSDSCSPGSLYGDWMTTGAEGTALSVTDPYGIGDEVNCSQELSLLCIEVDADGE